MGPANGRKLEVTISVEPISPQNTLQKLISLPAGSARLRDSVTLNPFDPPPAGVVIAGVRIADVDQLEITLGNIGTVATGQMLLTYDVLMRRI